MSEMKHITVDEYLVIIKEASNENEILNISEYVLEDPTKIILRGQSRIRDELVNTDWFKTDDIDLNCHLAQEFVNFYQSSIRFFDYSRSVSQSDRSDIASLIDPMIGTLWSSKMGNAYDLGYEWSSIFEWIKFGIKVPYNDDTRAQLIPSDDTNVFLNSSVKVPGSDPSEPTTELYKDKFKNELIDPAFLTEHLLDDYFLTTRNIKTDGSHRPSTLRSDQKIRVELDFRFILEDSLHGLISDKQITNINDKLSGIIGKLKDRSKLYDVTSLKEEELEAIITKTLGLTSNNAKDIDLTTSVLKQITKAIKKWSRETIHQQMPGHRQVNVIKTVGGGGDNLMRTVEMSPNNVLVFDGTPININSISLDRSRLINSINKIVKLHRSEIKKIEKMITFGFSDVRTNQHSLPISRLDILSDVSKLNNNVDLESSAIKVISHLLKNSRIHSITKIRDILALFGINMDWYIVSDILKSMLSGSDNSDLTQRTMNYLQPDTGERSIWQEIQSGLNRSGTKSIWAEYVELNFKKTMKSSGVIVNKLKSKIPISFPHKFESVLYRRLNNSKWDRFFSDKDQELEIKFDFFSGFSNRNEIMGGNITLDSMVKTNVQLD